MYAAACTSIAGHTFKIHSSDYFKIKDYRRTYNHDQKHQIIVNL